jgi:hypothetical protein
MTPRSNQIVLSLTSQAADIAESPQSYPRPPSGLGVPPEPLKLPNPAPWPEEHQSCRSPSSVLRGGKPPPRAILEPSLTAFSPRVRVAVTQASFLGFELEPPCYLTCGSEAQVACPWRHHKQRVHLRSFSPENLASSNPTRTVMIRFGITLRFLKSLP